MVARTWRFYLDYIRPHLAEEQGAVGPGEDAGEVEDTDALKMRSSVPSV
jgi:hypothetical protein|tara:strand:+ start:793 stop:939 length:147 start_codon:yes stop_codon:yes gene_type:complete